jgi:hypothetical protein
MVEDPLHIPAVQLAITSLGLLQAYLLPDDGSATFISPGRQRGSSETPPSLSADNSFRSSGESSSRSLIASQAPGAELIPANSNSAIIIPRGLMHMNVDRHYRCTDRSFIADLTLSFPNNILQQQQHDIFRLAFRLGPFFLTFPRIYLIATSVPSGSDAWRSHYLLDEGQLRQDLDQGYCRDIQGAQNQIDYWGRRVSDQHQRSNSNREAGQPNRNIGGSDPSTSTNNAEEVAEEDSQLIWAQQQSLLEQELQHRASRRVPFDISRLRKSWDSLSPEQQTETCIICLQTFEDVRESIAIPACRHLFHRKCLQGWADEKGNCPICRENL